jgi:hypothetical protein
VVGPFPFREAIRRKDCYSLHPKLVDVIGFNFFSQISIHYHFPMHLSLLPILSFLFLIHLYLYISLLVFCTPHLFTPKFLCLNLKCQLFPKKGYLIFTKPFIRDKASQKLLFSTPYIQIISCFFRKKIISCFRFLHTYLSLCLEYLISFDRVYHNRFYLTPKSDNTCYPMVEEWPREMVRIAETMKGGQRNEVVIGGDC